MAKNKQVKPQQSKVEKALLRMMRETKMSTNQAPRRRARRPRDAGTSLTPGLNIQAYGAPWAMGSRYETDLKFSQMGKSMARVTATAVLRDQAWGCDIPANPAMLPAGRVRTFYRLYGRYKNLSMTVMYISACPSAVEGIVQGGLVPYNAVIENPTLNLPQCDGGFGGSTWMPQKIDLPIAQYFDRWYPTYGSIADTNPFTYQFKADTGTTNNYGYFVVQYTSLVSSPVFTSDVSGFCEILPLRNIVLSNSTFDSKAVVRTNESTGIGLDTGTTYHVAPAEESQSVEGGDYGDDATKWRRWAVNKFMQLRPYYDDIAGEWHHRLWDEDTGFATQYLNTGVTKLFHLISKSTV